MVCKTFIHRFDSDRRLQSSLTQSIGCHNDGVDNASQEIELDSPVAPKIFTVDPVKFLEQVIQQLESDFTTFDGASGAHHPSARVLDIGTSGYSGNSSMTQGEETKNAK